jgi:Ion transport protein
MYIFSTDESLLETLDSLDNILVYIYTVEIVVKILGMGVSGYFLDTWNM